MVMKKLIVQNLKLILVVFGLFFLIAGNLIDLTYFKVNIGHLFAEIGALLLIVGFLHFLIDLRLREEMIRDVSGTIIGNKRIFDAGLRDCLLDSRSVREMEH